MMSIPEGERGTKSMSGAMQTEPEERKAAIKGQIANFNCVQCGGDRSFATTSKKRSLFDSMKIAFLSCCCIVAGWQLLSTTPVNHLSVEDANFSSTTSVKFVTINKNNSHWNGRHSDCCYQSNNIPSITHGSSRIGRMSRSKECEVHGVHYGPCGGDARKKVSVTAGGMSVQQLIKQKIALLSLPSSLFAEAKPTDASGTVIQRRLQHAFEQQAEEEEDDIQEEEDEEEAQLEQRQQQESQWETPMGESQGQQQGHESFFHGQAEKEEENEQTQHSCYRVDPSSSIPFFVDLRAFARSRCTQDEQTSPIITDNGKVVNTAASASPPHLVEDSESEAAGLTHNERKSATGLGLRSTSAAASFLYSAADAVKSAFAALSTAEEISPTEPSRDSVSSAAASETANLPPTPEDVVLQFLSVDWTALSALYRGSAFHASHTVPAAAAAEGATKNRETRVDGTSSMSHTSSRDDSAATVRTSDEIYVADQPTQRTDEKKSNSSSSSSNTTAPDAEAAAPVLDHQSAVLQRLLHNAEDKSIRPDHLQQQQQQPIRLPSGVFAATVSARSLTDPPADISVHSTSTTEEEARRPFSSAAGAFAAAARAAEAVAEAAVPATEQSHTSGRDRRSSTRQLHEGNEDEGNKDVLLLEPEHLAKGGAVALLRCVVKQQNTDKEQQQQQQTSTQSPHVPTHVHTEAAEGKPDEETARHDQQQKQQQGKDTQQRILLRSYGIDALEPVVLMPAPAQLQRQLAFKLRLHRQQRQAQFKTQKEEMEEQQRSKEEKEIPQPQQHSKDSSSSRTQEPSRDPLPALLQVVVPEEQSTAAAAWLRRVLLGPGIVATRWEAAALSAATSSATAHSLDQEAASSGNVFADASAFPAAAAARAGQRASSGGKRQQQAKKRLPGAVQGEQAGRFLQEGDQKQQKLQQEEEYVSLLHQQVSQTPLSPARDEEQYAHDTEEEAKGENERKETILQLPVWLVEIPLRDVVETWLPQPRYSHQKLKKGYRVNGIVESARRAAAAAANESVEEQEEEDKPVFAAKVDEVIEALSLHTAGDVVEEDVAAPARELEAAVPPETSTEEENISNESATILQREGGESAWTSLRRGIEEERMEEEQMRRQELLFAEVDRTLPFVLQQLRRYILFRYQERTAAAEHVPTTTEGEEKEKEIQQPLDEDVEYVVQQEGPSAYVPSRHYQPQHRRNNEQQDRRGAEKYSYTKISAFPHPTWAPHRNDSHDTQINRRNSLKSGSIGEESNKKGFMMAQVYVAGIHLRCTLLHSIGEACASSYYSSVPETTADEVRRSLLRDVALLGISHFSASATPPPATSDNVIRPSGTLKNRHAGGSAGGRNDEQMARVAAEAAIRNTRDRRPTMAVGEYHTGDDMSHSSLRNVRLPLPHEVVLVQHKHANENSDTIFYSLTCRSALSPTLQMKPRTTGAVAEEEGHQQNTMPGVLDAPEESCRASKRHVPLVPVSEDHLSLLPRMPYC